MSILTNNEEILAAVAKEVKRQAGADKRHEATTTDVTLKVTAYHGVFEHNQDTVDETERLSQARFCDETGLSGGTLTKGRTVALYVLGIAQSSAEGRDDRLHEDAEAIGNAVITAGGVDEFAETVRAEFPRVAEELGCAPSLSAIYNALKRSTKVPTDPFAQWVAQTEIARKAGVTIGEMVSHLERLLQHEVDPTEVDEAA